MRPVIFNPRAHSLLRGSALVLFSLAASFRLSDFPRDRPTILLMLPLLVAMAGTADTLRCMKKRWSLYHGGVLLLIYMDLMSIFIILFFLLYPYLPWFGSVR